MSVRVAGPADAEEVARLLDAFREWYDRDAPVYEEFLERVRHIMETERADYLLVSDDDRAVGVAQLRYRHSVWTGTDDCWLEDFFIDGSARRTGKGSLLLEAALDRAAERGCRRIELDVDEGNAAAQGLYKRFGFVSSKKPGERVFFFQRYL
jgi:GNAT superfamily N-acetyltransferase